MKTAIIGITTLISLAIATPIQAQSYQRTKVVAQMACSSHGPLVVNPEYYGQTRSGLDIWICIESGYGKQTFTMLNKGPYPVVACNIMECRVIDHTY